MIYLTTGANGSGKTLLTLKDVREQQLKEHRPVYYHGFEIEPAKANEFGWQEFDPKKWQDLPDGSICIMDECQNEFPLRRSGAEVPDYINAIAQFRRKRGFDFWMICPHPSLLDVFVRRLIDKPSWHRHLKRSLGAGMVSVLTFSSPDVKCEQPGSGARAEVSMRPFPKEVYGWYRSASLHTGKRKIPRAVWVVVAAAIIVPVLIWAAVAGVRSNVVKAKPDPVVASEAAGKVQPISTDVRADVVKLSADDYLKLRNPRLPDFPQTAPVYDDVTKPTVAPYPAACVHMGKVCKCYSQQATLLQVSAEVCLQIVERGYFVDWQQQKTPVVQDRRSHDPEPARLIGQAAPAPAPVIVNVPAPAQPQQPQLSGYEQALASRNAQVRSTLGR